MYGLKVLGASFTTDSTFSTAIFVEGYQFASVEMGDFTSGVVTGTANVYVQAAGTSTTGEFKRVKQMGVYSSGSGILDFEIPSSSGLYFTEIPAFGKSWIRLEISNSMTASVNAKVHAWNDN